MSTKFQDSMNAAIADAQEKAFKDAMQLGLGTLKIQHIPWDSMRRELDSMDRECIQRELRTINNGDGNIKPISGIPTDDAGRKRLQLWTFLMEYFPDTFLALVEVAIKGNEQHNPGQPLHWAREKSKDQMNTAFRHMFDYGRGVIRDTDGQYHLAKAIWRLSAQLQLDIEKEQRG